MFKITLPALLFLNVFQNPIKHLNEQLMMIWVCVFGTLLLFLLAEIFAEKFVADKRERGTFVQGVYRGNCSILICTPKVGLNNQLIKVQIFYD
ncbi:Hypothetical Uncharacterized protein [Avibacterium paragallinarum JF4211]|nr:Hypothetical Uncharacterized protein [Avibacterium paragallinarum JF4211]